MNIKLYLISLFILVGTSTLSFGQEMNAKKMYKYMKAGKNINKLAKGEDGHTVFHMFAWDWGYRCSDDQIGTIEYAIKHSGQKIKRPFWFFNDACCERQKDVLQYFWLLWRYGHTVSEKRFIELVDIYFIHKDGYCQTENKEIDYQDTYGKTPLMYACEYGYRDAVVKIMEHDPDLLLEDKRGKTAKDYCRRSKSLLKLLKATKL
ncbi:MAG: ankyrin repeat domain-containing protein [Aureispira sp.]|nr:ankyrin repeat domain-containing protein [Aureispira sp.]